MNYKTILACAALLTGMVFFNGRLNAAVESDVVGYSTITINPGFNMIAFNFQPLTGEAVSIQDFVTNKDDLVAGTSPTRADQIQVWNGTEFEIYFYRSYSTRFPAGPAWVKTTASTTVTEDTIPVGSGVWFARPKTSEAGSITVSGKITSESAAHTINPGFNMISAAFPADMALNNGPIDWAASGAVAGTSPTRADQIQVWNGTEFEIYFYRSYSTRFPAGPAWVKTTASTTVTEDKIPAGKGFWYARPTTATAGTLTETSPIAE